MCKNKIIVLIGVGIFLIGSTGFIYIFNPFHSAEEFQPVTFEINNLAVNDFTYLLQYDQFNSRTEAVQNLQNSEYDLIIMDAFYDETRWTSQEVQSMRDDASQPKILLCYVSIGEAETYRPYWDSEWDSDEDGVPDTDAPDWLDIENSEWEGNYKVKFWMDDWGKILFGTNSSYIDLVIAQGFSGIYMDIIDAFEYYEEQGDNNAPQKMVDFVKNISTYAKGINPHFLIVPQNGERLEEIEGYLDAVDGIGREDVEYTDNWKNDQEEIQSVHHHLQQFVLKGKFVLEVEYCSVPRFINNVYDSSTVNGYLCYVGSRDLANIQLNSPYMPD